MSESWTIVATEVWPDGRIRQGTSVGLASYEEVMRRIDAMLRLAPRDGYIREFVVIHPVDTHTNIWTFDRNGKRVS